ncbi:uncharacterized protein LOC111123109 [Crassostrea virginica]
MCSNKDGHCCADFKYMNGGCEPCYGAYGVNCTLNCNTGFYGFGCRSKCICHPEEFCDSRFGCIQNKQCQTLPFIVAFIIIGCLCLILLAYIVYKRFTIKRKDNRITYRRKAEDTGVSPSCLELEPRPVHSNQQTLQCSSNISNNLHLQYGPISESRESFYSQPRCTKLLSMHSYDKFQECSEDYHRLK